MKNSNQEKRESMKIALAAKPVIRLPLAMSASLEGVTTDSSFQKIELNSYALNTMFRHRLQTFQTFVGMNESGWLARMPMM